jgi:hypothetical protein
VQELQVWRPLAAHVVEQVAAGQSRCLPRWTRIGCRTPRRGLPDRAREDHDRRELDRPGARAAGYFHNAGYFELGARTSARSWGPDAGIAQGRPPSLCRIREVACGLRAAARAALRRCLARQRPPHLARAPADNPFPALPRAVSPRTSRS